MIYRTAADQLAEVFEENDIAIIKSSYRVNKFLRAIDVLGTIVFRFFSYKIAIVPFYASSHAFIIENVSIRLLKFLGKKVILIVHGGRIPRLLKNEDASKYLKVLNRVNIVISPSPYLQHEIGKYGIKCEVIENVVKISDYQFVKKDTFKPLILWMRAFTDTYNPNMAVRVFAMLKKKYPEAKMVMAGKDMGLLNETKAVAKSLSVLDSITFPGYVQTIDKTELAKHNDIYICTNKEDNAPVTFVEMMTLGLPVVSVNVGGIPYMIENGHNGLLVDYEDVDAMSEAISSIIENPELGKKIVANGRNTSKNYAEDVIINKWTNLLKKLS